MSTYLQRAEKIVDRINELAAISEDSSCVTRTYGTPSFVEGSKKVLTWMNEAGLQTHIDNIGNVRGKLVSKKAGAKTFVIASHIDTVVNAGKFDGPLGVIMGIDLVEHIKNTDIDFNIEIIAFSDEEGVRFHTTFLGSNVVTGNFDTVLLNKKDANGILLREVITSNGGNPNQLVQDAIPKESWLGYYEMHIEQGPVLYEKNIPAAVVTAIAGQKRIEVALAGFAGHAGTVPMDMRQDALAAAAVCILAIERFGLENKDHIVATVGKLEVNHAASNVIPGKVVFSIDLRGASATYLEQAYHTIEEICTTICKARNIGIEWNLVQETAPVLCDKNLSNLLSGSIKEAGHSVIELVSGAGHDAMAVATVSPVSMLFIRCYKGISHNPLENAEVNDIAEAIKISEAFIQNLIQQHS
ncbi:allantoate amidohydrolase [Ferruginibacter sp. SUN002]|uniref:allantoate amidohydrolase n=1 Tax=Ferruginibacter sp. SUN002 TaxID=2937789 RepID=UPI003D36390B